MVTAYDVARRAAVSVGTVSRYLNENGYVGGAARERIRAAIEELGYVPSSAARSLTTKKTGLIGFVVVDVGNPFTAELAHGLQERAAQHGYNVVISATDDDEDRALEVLRALRSHHVDGFVVTTPGGERTNDQLVAIARQGTPIVLVGMQMDPPLADIVTTDTYDGARAAVDHLVACGHRRIGFIGPTHLARDRRLGYLDSLDAAGLEVDMRLLVEAPLSRAGGQAATERLLDLRRPPTAIFAANDAAALGVVQASYQRQLRIPDDLSVVGFDDVDLAAHAVPPLTTVAQPKQQVGHGAVDMLVARLDGSGPAEPVERSLPCRLVVRESTGTAPGTSATPKPVPSAAKPPASATVKPPARAAVKPPARAAAARRAGRNGRERSA